MQGAIRGGDALDGARRLSPQLRQEQDAGVQRAAAGGVANHDGSDAAPARRGVKRGWVLVCGEARIARGQRVCANTSSCVVAMPQPS